MNGDEFDLTEILRSPLEPEAGEEAAIRSWWLPGLSFGVAAAVAAIVVISADDSASENVPITTAPTVVATSTGTVIAAPQPFPADYVAIGPDVAVRPEPPVRDGDRLLLPFTSVVRRGADPSAVPRPLGGRWELTTPGGAVAANRVVYDTARPSVFAVEFPAPPDGPSAVSLVERWDATEVMASVELPWPGLPYETSEAIEMDLGGGATLRVSSLELGNFQGRAIWELVGADLGVVGLQVEMINPDGSTLGEYSASVPNLDPTPGEGYIDFGWLPGIRVDQNEAASFVLTANVSLGTAVPTDIEIALPPAG